MKRGQISFFIIAGFILAVLLVTIVLFQESPLVDPTKPISYVNLNRIVESCLDETAKEGLIQFGLKGGQIYQGKTFNNLIMETGYGLKQGLVFIPDENEVKNQLTKFIEDNILLCYNKSFSAIKAYDFLKINEPVVQVEILENSIEFQMDPNINYISETENVKLNQVRKEYNLNLRKILNISRSIIETIRLQDIVPFATLTNIDDDLEVNVQTISQKVVLYSIYDSSQDYLFRFVVDIKDIENYNLPPEVEEIPAQEVGVNESFVYEVIAVDPEGDEISYEAITTLFEMDGNLIEFETDESMIGEHNIPIIVSDEENSATTYLELVIK